MSLGYRSLVFTALLAAGVASSGAAQRGVVRPKRPYYGYFKYHIPRIHLRDDLAFRARERAWDRLDWVRNRQFALQDRVRERGFELPNRAWRRQLEARERAFSRMHERLEGMPKFRPFMYRRHWRTI
jgi:hypothetical protein